MTTYISLLRGINVSGNRPLKMEALRELLNGLGFKDIRTYVQSGNVTFNADNKTPEGISTAISKGIEKAFGYDVPALTLTIGELEEAITELPFKGHDPKHLHITFLSEPVEATSIEELEPRKQDGEEIVLAGKRIYLYCPHGYGRSKLNNTFIENKLNVRATTRNWKTTNKLLELAKEIAGNTQEP